MDTSENAPEDPDNTEVDKLPTDTMGKDVESDKVEAEDQEMGAESANGRVFLRAQKAFSHFCAQ